MANENSILISYGTSNPFVCSLHNEKMVSLSFEKSFRNTNQLGDIFPETAFKNIMREMDNLEYIYVLGNPKIYFANLWGFYKKLFPYNFFNFGRDIKHFYKDTLLLKNNLYKILPNESIKNKIKKSHVRFLDISEVLLNSFYIEEESIVIISCSDILERSLCNIYIKKNGILKLQDKVPFHNSFAEFSKMYNAYKNQILLDEITSSSNKSVTGIDLAKRRISGHFKYIELKQKDLAKINGMLHQSYLQNSKDIEEVNQKILCKYFESFISKLREKSGLTKIILLTDEKNLEQALIKYRESSSVEIRVVDTQIKIESALQYITQLSLLQ